MTTQSLELVVGIFVPLLVSVVKREAFPQYVNAAIAIVVYAVVGLLAVLISGQAFDLNNIAPTVAIFVGEGTIAYQLWWKNWGDPQITAYIAGKPKAA